MNTMNKEEFRQRAALAAFSECVKFIVDNGPVEVRLMKEGCGTRILPSNAPFDAAEAAVKFADALVEKMSEVVPEQKPISDETREEMIKQYRDMMKANEGKSFEERRDAINKFRAGKVFADTLHKSITGEEVTWNW